MVYATFDGIGTPKRRSIRRWVLDDDGISMSWELPTHKEVVL